jgi:2-oxoglutarate dehydrogenase E2 component (dihydrolipoamide succinyltransferase)
MAAEIKVPSLGESVTEAVVSKWLKKPGEAVALDDPVVELETDKATLEIGASAAGTLAETLVEEGASVAVGAVIARIAEGPAAAASRPPAAAEPASATLAAKPSETAAEKKAPDALLERVGPAARKLIAERGIDSQRVAPSGPGRRIAKADVIALAEEAPAPAAPAPAERERRIRMSALRRRIALNLKAAQLTAAILTTFNEIDMSAAIAARERYRELFERKHGVRLGFMSFFVKAAIAALKELPNLNAEIDGEDIVYKNHYDIGVAVATEEGLVVPVVRDADRLGFAEIEKAIADLARKGREGRLTIAELSGGTFTISNGGIYGSLLSTPILNPPQSGILGMHKIERRPIASGEKVEIRPMMYVALSYDHRLVDGREAVTFLVRLKETIEDPSRMLFEI